MRVAWRLGVSLALISATVRSGPLGSLLIGPVWYALQFGPLFLLALAQFPALVNRAWWRQRSWLAAVSSLGVVVLALASAAWAPRSMETLQQAGVLAASFLFFLSTFAGRWASQEVLADDIRTVFWVGFSLSLVGLVAMFAGQTWAIWPTMRLVGLAANPNYTGMVAAISVALGFAVPGRLARVAAIVPLVALLLSGSRGSVLGLVVGLGVLFAASPSARASKFDRILAGVASVGLAALVWFAPRIVTWIALWRVPSGAIPGSWVAPSVNPPDGVPPVVYDVTSGRLDIYLMFLKQWTQAPFFGMGYRSSAAVYGFEAHNIYLSILVELGLFGAVLFAGLIIGLWRSAASGSAMICAAASVLASELFESSLFGFGGPSALMFWLVLFGWAATGTHGRGQAAQPVVP